MNNKKLKRERKAQNHQRGSKYRNNLLKKATKQELILRDALIEEGVIFSFQKLYFDEKKVFILDFYLKTRTGRYNIEIDGAGHFTPKGREYDQKRAQWMYKRRKTKTIRFTNSQVDHDLDKVVAKILMLLPYKIKQPDYQ